MILESKALVNIEVNQRHKFLNPNSLPGEAPQST